MPRRPDPGIRQARYPLRFGTAAFLLISGTLVLVLFVLPERYVISAGFRESGLSFPAPVTPFLPSSVVPVAARPLPAIADTLRPDTPPPPPAPTLLDRIAIAFDAGRPRDAVPLLRELLAEGEDEAARLALARTLRDLGLIDAASEEYARLAAARPGDVDLTLEWALAHAWVRDYERAVEILSAALRRTPGAVPLRVELARTYFALGRPADAAETLAALDEAALAAAGAVTLRDDVLAALFVPPPPPDTVQPTRVELAARARVAGDFAAARAALRAALAENPDDAEAWQAYADLLEYEFADMEGAHAALLEVARLSGFDADRELRLARLEIWAERGADAETRLQALLAALPPRPAGSDPGAVANRERRAETLALLGDLRRWGGDRPAAARQYRLALAEDGASARARDGLAALDAEVARQVWETEAPRRGGRAYALTDSDDFSRTDLGAEWVEVGPGAWVWGGAAGNRWLGGVDLAGTPSDRQGVFVDLHGARWWREGTVRTGVSLGAERVRSTWDLLVGASVAHRGSGGRQTSELRYERGPAHPLTSTLQSVSAALVQDRVSATHARTVGGGRGSVVASVEGAWIRPETATSSADGTTRLQAALTVGRRVREPATVGLTARALTLLHAAPTAALPGGGALALFWDPRWAVSAGPFLRLDREVSPGWRLTGQLAPGLALLRERTTPSATLVPHVGAEAGFLHTGPQVRAALDLFYYQGQFDGYKSYGLRLSLGRAGRFSGGEGP